jgi:hypothetical protein
MAEPRCPACEDVGQVAVFHDAAAAAGAPQWLLDAAEDAAPLPLILNCPRCGGGKVNVIAATSFVDFEGGTRLSAEDLAS